MDKKKTSFMKLSTLSSQLNLLIKVINVMRWNCTVTTPPPIMWPIEEKAKYGPDPSCRLSAQHVSMCFITPKKVSRLCLCEFVCVLCVYAVANSLCILVQGPYACVGVHVRKSLRVHICVCAGGQQKPSMAVFWNLLFPAAPCPW